MSATFEIVLLGTGSPLPSENRCGAGQVIIAGDAKILLDCGWGAARRVFSAGILPASIDHAFFTHMHSDHITDLPDFMVMRWTLGATTPLRVYGPRGTQQMVDGFLAALADDTRFRIEHHEGKLSPDGMRCIVQEIPETPDVSSVASVDGVQVGAFEVDHRPVRPALGFTLERDGAKVVFSGDTKKCDNLVRAASDADLLVSEAVNVGLMNVLIQRQRDTGNPHAASMLADVESYHAPTLDVAAMARDARVKHLLISHLIPPVPNDGPVLDQFVAGMSDVFTGKITIGKDLMRISV